MGEIRNVARLNPSVENKRASESTVTLATISSEDLFGKANEVCISHDGLLYRLRITKQGKLILNK